MTMTTTDIATMIQNVTLSLGEAILGLERGDDMLETSNHLLDVAEAAKEAAMFAYELYEQTQDLS